MLNEPVPSGCFLIRRTIGRFHVLTSDIVGMPLLRPRYPAFFARTQTKPPMNAPESLPLEFPAFDNSFAALPEAFYTRLKPQPLPAPYVVGVSAEVAELLGLPPQLLE
jgi:hypothetical protein